MAAGTAAGLGNGLQESSAVWAGAKPKESVTQRCRARGCCCGVDRTLCGEQKACLVGASSLLLGGPRWAQRKDPRTARAQLFTRFFQLGQRQPSATSSSRQDSTACWTWDQVGGHGNLAL